jgi:FMN-dependent NADH-azoreductase
MAGRARTAFGQIDILVNNADAVVIGAPMYNFSVSSQLKVWIDRIVVAGRTFKYS